MCEWAVTTRLSSPALAQSAYPFPLADDFAATDALFRGKPHVATTQRSSACCEAACTPFPSYSAWPTSMQLAPYPLTTKFVRSWLSPEQTQHSCWAHSSTASWDQVPLQACWPEVLFWSLAEWDQAYLLTIEHCLHKARLGGGCSTCEAELVDWGGQCARPLKLFEAGRGVIEHNISQHS